MPTHRRRRSRVSLPVAALVAATLTVPVSAPAGAVAPPVPEPATELATGAESHQVTLVTGDVVTMTTLPGEEQPAYRLDPQGPSRGAATIERTEDGTYVVPLAAQRALVDDAVDLALFDVAQLVADGYDDATTDEVPLVLDNHEGKATPEAAAQATVTSDLESIGSLGVEVPKGKARAFWQEHDAASERKAAHVDKLWLDAKVEVELADSVPQIGAPALWETGLDGDGVTVAVLDTGVDDSHPDLAGRVSEKMNFTEESDAGDHFGHGTHVAATIGGAGAGNGAKGVAPAVDLVSVKVLDDTGSGTITDIIDGMEWAAETGADIVNMSLGTNEADDGRGPVSVSVNRLAERYGTLFVVSAGNSGPNTIGSPASADDALTVGAVDKADALAGFSSTGPRAGDGAIKPEISAPGVGIVAARAAGTGMGVPVDDLYTSADGTSMASPHVAGAAALVKQAHPDWTWQQLKSALIGAADPGSYRVERGGAGRVDVPRAVEQGAYAVPATLDLGHVRYAETGQYQPVTGEVEIRNVARTERTFTLTTSVTTASNGTLPAGAMSLSASEVTVPAGGSVPVTVSFDPNLLPRETYYSGVVTAVATDSSASVRVPVSVYVEPLMYDVTIRGIGKDGKPAAPNSLVYVHPEQAGRITRATFHDGVATVRVKPGRYAIETMLMTADAGGQWVRDLSLDVRSGVEVNGDISVDLDARDAAELTYDTGRKTERQSGALTFRDFTVLLSPDFKHVSLFPTEAPVPGSSEVVVHSTLTAPVLTASVGRERLEPTQLDGAKRLEGQVRLTVVDVGDGTAAGFGRKNVRGKLVLATLSGTARPTEIVKTAAARGAAAVAIGNDGPGRLVATVRSRAVPAFALHGEDAQRLRALAADRASVAVDLAGTPYSPYVYDLVTPFVGAVTAGPLEIAVDATNTAEVTVRTYERGTDDGVHLAYSRRARTTAPMVESQVPTRLGQELEQIVSADPTTRYWNGSALGGTGFAYFENGWHTYEPGSESTVEYYKAVNNTRVNSLGHSGTYLYVGGAAFPDGADPAHQASLAAYGDDLSMALTRDGEPVGQTTTSSQLGVAVPEGEAQYQAVLDARRDLPGWKYAPHTMTTWSFRADVRSGTWGSLPMPQIGYDIDVDLENEVRAGTRQSLTVTALPWQAGDPAVADVSTWISYDDGENWTRLRLRATAEPGVWTAAFDVPEGARAPDYVSLRTTATDTAGSSVDQTVDRAFGVETPGRD